MKKLLVLVSLALMSILSYSSEKSPEEIMNGLREKATKEDQEKINKEKEVELKKESEYKEAMELIEKKRKELISEPLTEKFYRSEDKVEATKKAMNIGKSRMSFIKEDTLSEKYDKVYSKFEENSEKVEKLIEEREKLQKQLRELDLLERKIKN